jgi:carboxypeptidase C (cathepsin A)
MIRLALASTAALAFFASASAAETSPPTAAAPAPPAKQSGPPATTAPVFAVPTGKHLRVSDMPKPRRFVMRHQASIRGQTISYEARAGGTYITNIEGEPVADIFSFSYVKLDKAGRPDPRRPVVFVFNGGPGSGSLWLHVAAFAPRQAVLDRDVNPSNIPPFGLAANDDSLLDTADLVFIDPVGTGFSHAVAQAQDTDFASVDADADSVARFIEAWLSDNGRYNSPKFVVGESYGSVRASVLPRALMGGPSYMGLMRGITLNGIVIVGPVIGGGAEKPNPDADEEGLAALLPGMAVTALYHRSHGRSDAAVSALYDEVSDFARTVYLPAILAAKKGALADADRDRIAQKLEAYTAIPATTWIQRKLIIDPVSYTHLALASRGLDVGTYDSRYTLPTANSGHDFVADDPAMGQYVPGLVAAFHRLMAEEFGVRMPYPYLAINFDLNMHWKYAGRLGVQPEQTYAGDLAVAMRRQPHMQLMVATGYYDMLATPASLVYQLQEGHVPRSRTRLKRYLSGHMLYLGGTSHQFSDDVRDFVLDTLKQKGGAAE